MIPQNSLEQRFEQHVAIPFVLYNGLFLGLPFEALRERGAQLPSFTELCRQQLKGGDAPDRILDDFFDRLHQSDPAQQIAVLFTLVQLVERQVVLFDAIEDAAFSALHDPEGPGSLAHLLGHVAEDGREADLSRELDRTATRIVLTAHPTQFYPDAVLAIQADLRRAVSAKDPSAINRLLLQLGKTRLSNLSPPTPLDEVNTVLSYVETVFFDVLPAIQRDVLAGSRRGDLLAGGLPKRPNLELGFWPGGDRDGNPFVTAGITVETGRLLKERVLACYLRTVRKLERRLTFDGVAEDLRRIRERLTATCLAAAPPPVLATDVEADAKVGRQGLPTFESVVRALHAGTVPAAAYPNPDVMLSDVLALRHRVVADHQGLFVDLVDELVFKVFLFGFHFASIDIRQTSSVFRAAVSRLLAQDSLTARLGLDATECRAYAKLEEPAKLRCLERIVDSGVLVGATEQQELSPVERDAVEAFQAVLHVQRGNGWRGAHRVVISHTASASHALEVLALARLAGVGPEERLDVVPLFESVAALERAHEVMALLYESAPYRAHVAAQGGRQVIMVGFSDGTKDGGYLAANWAIHSAKVRLTAVSRRYGVEAVFFDGRGGPPGRGGGHTHLFYRAAGSNVEQLETQLTIQGQTISTNFGTPEAARHNVEQLFTANLTNRLFAPTDVGMAPDDGELLELLAQSSLTAYRSLRDDADCVAFLVERTPLPLFHRLNIASRPVSRGPQGDLSLEHLRAIPFVGAWSTMRLVVPGFYGLGAALDPVLERGEGARLRKLYLESLFFRTLVDNAIMSLAKSDVSLTGHLDQDPRFGRLWRRIRDEALRTRRCLLAITGQNSLLGSEPLQRASIGMREEIMLPVLVILQASVTRLEASGRIEGAEGEASPEAGPPDSIETRIAARYRKLALKAVAAVINASRNAA